MDETLSGPMGEAVEWSVRLSALVDELKTMPDERLRAVARLMQDGYNVDVEDGDPTAWGGAVDRLIRLDCDRVLLEISCKARYLADRRFEVAAAVREGRAFIRRRDGPLERVTHYDDRNGQIRVEGDTIPHWEKHGPIASIWAIVITGE